MSKRLLLSAKLDDLQELISSSTDAMIIVDSSGKITHCNNELEKLFGYVAGELPGASLDILLPERFRKKHRVHHKQFFSKPAIRPMSAGLDLSGCRKDGTELPVEITLHPFETEDGTLVYAAVKDVSAIRRTRYLLAAALDKVTLFYKDIPVGLCFFDCDLRYLLVNDWLAGLNGISADDHLGRRISEIIPEIAAAGVELQLRSVIKTGKPIVGGSVDAETSANPGQIRSFQHNYFPVQSDDRKIIGVSCVVEDITDRKRAEAALLKTKQNLEEVNKDLDSKVELLGIKNTELEAYDHTIAHSLKTSLSASIHVLQILSNFNADNLNEEQIQLLRRAHTDLENAGESVDALLMLSTISDEQVEPKPLDMKRLVHEALRQLENERLSVQAIVQMPDTWLPAAGHAPWVGEVWLNYLSNAFKYCGPPVILDLGCLPDGPDSVCYWVRDNGKLLTQAEREQLFVPFFRLHHNRNNGHGLGLTIVQRVVEKLGGIAGVDTLDGGNRFFFTLPAVRDIPTR
jgi:PAS domain S-box-containing protein